MWYVKEYVKGGIETGIFGPFEKKEDAAEFLIVASFTWSNECIEKIEIYKESTQ